MDFLYFLQGLRTPWLDAVMSALTNMGGELVFLVVALTIFWCRDKRQGYYMLSVGFLGTLFNQFLKITCRIPRPWVRDPNFPIVESARAEATGYSFPSGHSTSSVGTFGVIATEGKRRWVRLTAVALCFLIPFTRLYLGVHTPADVLVGSAIPLFCIIALRPCFYHKDGALMPWLLGAMAMLAAVYVAYLEFFPFPADTDPTNYAEAVKNSYTLLGAVAGVLVVWVIDRKRDFSTEAPLGAQILKTVLGLILVLAVKEGLKYPLETIFGGHMIARAIRYFAVVIFAGVLWPMTFPRLAALGRKEDVKK